MNEAAQVTRHSNRQLGAVPTGHFKRAGGFLGLDELIREKGGDPRQLFGRFGIREADMADPECYVPYPSMIRLLEYCVDLFKSPHFGLELGSKQSIEAIGPLAPLLLASRTVREGIGLVARYMAVHAPGARMELAETETTLSLGYAVRDRSVTRSRAGNEFIMASALSILRAAFGDGLRVAEVGLASAPFSSGSRLVEQHFEAPVIHDQPISYLAIPVAVLEREVDSGNPVLLKFARMQCDALCPDDVDDIDVTVAGQVRRLLPRGECNLEAVASRLAMHPRSLQSRLARKGIEFRTIVREQRRALAEAYLRHTATPLAEVALLLGYADQATFTRAFTDWTGTSPRRYRVANNPRFPRH